MVTCRDVSFSRTSPPPIFWTAPSAKVGVDSIAASMPSAISSIVLVTVNKMGVANGLFRVPSSMSSNSNVVELPSYEIEKVSPSAIQPPKSLTFAAPLVSSA